MSDALQALLDSGALYLTLGAVICIVLGVGAARRLFQRAKKIEPPQRRKDYRSPGRFGVTFDALGTIFRTGAAHIALLGPIRIAQRPRQRTPGTLPNPESRA
jgi:hypothetical protein